MRFFRFLMENLMPIKEMIRENGFSKEIQLSFYKKINLWTKDYVWRTLMRYYGHIAQYRSRPSSSSAFL